MLRKLHRFIGLVFAPFFLITAVTGGLLLFRHFHGADGQEIMSEEVEHGLIHWHNWEGIKAYVPYLGLLLAAALALMAITGLTLWVQVRSRKRKAKPV